MTGEVDHSSSTNVPRTYMVVIDETAEAHVALRFAARRASKTEGHVLILAVIPPAEFIQWGGVQAAMEDETFIRVEELVAQVAGEMMEDAGIRPAIIVRQGEPRTVITETLYGEYSVDALVLGAAAKGAPGPLVSYFSGDAAGQLPCPLMIIPGGLSDEAIDRLS